MHNRRWNGLRAVAHVAHVAHGLQEGMCHSLLDMFGWAPELTKATEFSSRQVLMSNASAWYRGCLHTGQRVTRFLRQSVNSKDATARHAAVYATQAGSLGYVAPLLDQSAEPLLQKLQRQLVLAQPQAAGLNPAAFRYGRKHK